MYNYVLARHSGVVKIRTLCVHPNSTHEQKDNVKLCRLRQHCFLHSSVCSQEPKRRLKSSCLPWSLHQGSTHHKCVTAVARKRSRSFCQKCRRHVTAKHACTLRMWLCMKWHGAWLYCVHRTCAETAAVSCGTSHASAVSTPLRWILKKRAIQKNAL